MSLEDAETGAARQMRARMIVNAGGPWVGDIIRNRIRSDRADGVRLVRGGHIVTRRLFDHDKCYFLQGADGRILFAIPYETDFTLIGTTEQNHDDPAMKPVCTEEEQTYMIDFINGYLKRPITADDIVWTYSGVRPLHGEGASSATAATRDYTLKLDRSAGAPVLNIFGGKITTYRRLAESALELVGREFGGLAGPWTAGAPMPGGDFPVDGVDALIADLKADYPFLTVPWAKRLVRAFGTEARHVLGEARAASDLGRDFGATLTAAEVDWLMDREYARTAEDVLWRRSKLGLRLSRDAAAELEDYMARRRMLAAAE